ncbi:hypothetical protein AAFC00_004679 [Neodothiora populina]|uniref:Uncharacterized protein n=1 Tax=Neodothiora populina TaxID=2781224 RepID=A0ABR3P338_9PEZI
MTDSGLDAEQTAALVDVLSHVALYDEVCAFKTPAAIQGYGRPFQDRKGSSAPLLQILLSSFVLKLPGLRDIAPDFWKTRVEKLLEDLAAAELSESYDKGVLGIRKTLATAASALLEYPARGCIGGFPKDESAFKDRTYDPSKPDDVLDAWQDFRQQLVYGDLFDKLFVKAAETDNLKKHDTLVQAAHEYVVVNLASFMHYTLVLSPEGPSLLRLVENVHKLAPYGIMRQTLRIGNVATMLSGMVRLMLAKVSVGTVTNFLGLSSGADEGMNLLQQIISTVLGWDKKELKKRADKIEKDKEGPSKEVREALKQWTSGTRKEHEECRERSKQESMSIVAVILSLSSASADMSEEQHAKALEYLSLQLSIRDRDEITRVLCRSNPDHLTQAIRDGVSAYEPMIRQVHQAVDLSATVGDFQAFVDDMIKLTKPDKKSQASETKSPTVEDYVKLLHTHMGACHRFLHQVAKNGKEVTKWFQDYVHIVAAEFKSSYSTPDTKKDSARDIYAAMQASFTALNPLDQTVIREELKATTTYLSALHDSSAARIRDVINNTSSTTYGPGAFLARWQDLLDSTPITPSKPQGPVRTGADKSVKQEGRKDVDGEIKDAGIDSKQVDKEIGNKTPEAPSAENILRVLGPRFRELLVEMQ